MDGNRTMDDIGYNAEWIEVDGNHIHRTAIISPYVKMGTGNWIGAYSVIGSNGEIRGKDPKGFEGVVFIGDNNVISEHVTIQRPFEENQATVIGSNNIIMAHAHIGHDVQICDNCEICTGVILGGYSKIGNNVKIKLGATVRNRMSIYDNALVGLGSAVVKPVEHGSVVYGNPARPKDKPL